MLNKIVTSLKPTIPWLLVTMEFDALASTLLARGRDCVASVTVIGHRYGVKVIFQIRTLTWQQCGCSTVRLCVSLIIVSG